MSNIILPSNWRFQQNKQELSVNSSTKINLEPNIITASENVQRFSFDALEINPSATKASLTFTITGAILNTEIVEITSIPTKISLMASNAPSFGQFYVDGINTISSRIAVAQAIANELQNSLAFSNFYDIKCEDTTIYIEAKDYGSQYNLVLTAGPATIFVISNIVGTSKYSYNSLKDYSTFIDVYMSNSSYKYGNPIDRIMFDKVFNFDVPFEENVFNIDTHSITKNYVDVELPEKKLNYGFNVKLLDETALNNNKIPILRPYYLIYGDSFRYVVNGEKKDRLQGCSSIRWVQNASQHPLNPYDLTEYVWDTFSTNSFKWLTDSKDYIPVNYNSHQYLQVINLNNPKAKGYYRIEMKCVFYDGSTYTLSFQDIPYTDIWNNISFDVSPNVFDLEGIETTQGKLIDYYQVYLVWTPLLTSSERISEVKTYKFRRICSEQLTFIWFNKFGGWDSLDFIGILNKERNRTYSELKRNLPFNANTSDSISYELNLLTSINTKEIININSGMLDISHYEWLKDITLSTSVFVWDNILNKYISVVIENSDYNFNSDNSEFNLRIAFRFTDLNSISR